MTFTFFVAFASRIVHSIYTWYLAEMWNSATFSPVNSRSTGGDEKKGQEEDEGIPDSTQRSHLTIPSRFDAAGGCSRHVVSPTLCPFSTFRIALALPNTHTHTYKPIQTSECLYPCRSCFLFVYPYIPLPIRARFTGCREWSPRTSNRPWPFSVYPCYKY